MQAEFATGDVVKLNSGGPLLAVLKLDGEWARCVWFDTLNQAHTEPFHIGTVALVTSHSGESVEGLTTTPRY
jgi:uncharacterized protein YodC (DUF2158 family)